jgi:hypothetical protein
VGPQLGPSYGLHRKAFYPEASTLPRQDSPLHLAAVAGRSIAVAAILNTGCVCKRMIDNKNRDLMTALQLSVSDDAPGSCAVVRLLAEASGRRCRTRGCSPGVGSR